MRIIFIKVFIIPLQKKVIMDTFNDFLPLKAENLVSFVAPDCLDCLRKDFSNYIKGPYYRDAIEKNELRSSTVGHVIIDTLAEGLNTLKDKNNQTMIKSYLNRFLRLGYFLAILSHYGSSTISVSHYNPGHEKSLAMNDAIYYTDSANNHLATSISNTKFSLIKFLQQGTEEPFMEKVLIEIGVRNPKGKQLLLEVFRHSHNMLKFKKPHDILFSQCTVLNKNPGTLYYIMLRYLSYLLIALHKEHIEAELFNKNIDTISQSYDLYKLIASYYEKNA